ncbi:MAG: hypothetical protein V1697_02955 [Candidatus Levyibacteriota bacterium]
MQTSNLKYKTALLLFFAVFLIFNVGFAFADTMTNDWYILQMGNFNMSSGKPTGPDYTVSFTAGQISPGLYSGANYTVRSGFQYIYTLVPFSFSISQTSIDFGVLTPANPITRTNTLTVNNQSAGGYTVTSSENHQLLTPATGALIPDTTCDDGLCTPSNASAWASSLTYGFGYRCDDLSDTDCVIDFSDSSYYKPFSASPSATVVMSGAISGTNKQSQVTYKVNISANQPAGTYTNLITYIAAPTF